jgi:hypothetical protein
MVYTVHTHLRVRGSAKYPPIFSHFFCASSQDELTAVSRNLKQPSADASSQSPKIVEERWGRTTSRSFASACVFFCWSWENWWWIDGSMYPQYQLILLLNLLNFTYNKKIGERERRSVADRQFSPWLPADPSVRFYLFYLLSKNVTKQPIVLHSQLISNLGPLRYRYKLPTQNVLYHKFLITKFLMLQSS